MPNRRKLLFASSTDGSRTHRHSRRFELRRFAGLRTVLSWPASPMGFEPTISCVTGRRALRAAPRGQIVMSVAQVGLEPTASLVLSQGGLPIAYRADRFCGAQSRTRTCNRAGLSRAALPVGVSGPRWSRMDSNHRFPGCGPGVFAARPRDRRHLQWTHRESHPDLQRAELASSCWTMSPNSRRRFAQGTPPRT